MAKALPVRFAASVAVATRASASAGSPAARLPRADPPSSIASIHQFPVCSTTSATSSRNSGSMTCPEKTNAIVWPPSASPSVWRSPVARASATPFAAHATAGPAVPADAKASAAAARTRACRIASSRSADGSGGGNDRTRRAALASRLVPSLESARERQYPLSASDSRNARSGSASNDHSRAERRLSISSSRRRSQGTMSGPTSACSASSASARKKPRCRSRRATASPLAIRRSRAY